MKMPSFPAQRLGIPDRGLLRDGLKVDIVVFDALEKRGHFTSKEVNSCKQV